MEAFQHPVTCATSSNREPLIWEYYLIMNPEKGKLMQFTLHLLLFFSAHHRLASIAILLLMKSSMHQLMCVTSSNGEPLLRNISRPETKYLQKLPDAWRKDDRNETDFEINQTGSNSSNGYPTTTYYVNWVSYNNLCEPVWLISNKCGDKLCPKFRPWRKNDKYHNCSSSLPGKYGFYHYQYSQFP